MPTRTLRALHFSDAQVLAFFEAVMARWPTNAPLLAVGGFSYSFPGEEWRRAIQATDTNLVTSATLAERDAAFSIVFRRSRDGREPDEISVAWNEPDAQGAGFPADDAARLGELADRFDRQAVPMLPSG